MFEITTTRQKIIIMYIYTILCTLHVYVHLYGVIIIVIDPTTYILGLKKILMKLRYHVVRFVEI